MLALDEALTRLAALDAEQARIVELRYFGGLTVEETAEAIGSLSRHRQAAVGDGARVAEARDRLRGRRSCGWAAVKREQWERLKALFNDALDQPAETRHEWLSRQTGGDEMLAREAAALLLAHEGAEGFLETPVQVDPADIAGTEEPAGGARYGSYEIEFEIGRGGMGIVYCARDGRLGRRVALKALPPLQDGDAGAARAAAARGASGRDHLPSRGGHRLCARGD